MDSGLYDSGQMAFSKALQNEARINRLEIILKALCSKLGAEIAMTKIEEPDPQLMECMRLIDECVEESRASACHPGSGNTPKSPTAPDRPGSYPSPPQSRASTEASP